MRPCCVTDLTHRRLQLPTLKFMTAARHLTSLRPGLLMVAGIGLITAPFALGAGTPVVVTGLVVGVLTVALSLAGTDASGRGTLPLSAQAVYHRGLGTGLVLAGSIFGLAGEGAGLAVFGAAGLLTLLTASVSRYSAHPA